MKEVLSSSEEETLAIAAAWASKFKGHEVVGLSGELGAGKTVFAKGLAAGLGLKDSEKVCSPSFTIVNVYQARIKIFHIDLYRLNTRSEVTDLGLDDYLYEGVLMIEWPEKMPRIPGSFLVELKVLDDGKRLIRIDSGSK